MMINSMKKLLIPLALCLSFNAVAYKEDDLKRVRELATQTFHGKAIDLNLSKIDLSGARLSAIYLNGANLSGANLSGANLSGAVVVKVNLSGANLSGADLRVASLMGANLSNANLTNANLSNAKLTGANLSKANLTGATLTEANLTDADLTGTTFPKPIQGWSTRSQGPKGPKGQKGQKIETWNAGNYEGVIFANKQLLPQVTRIDKNTSAAKITELLTTLGAKIAE